ncbi:MAG TPA: L,D-transpeptidase family protein [Aestuariivirgaceae bacterium]
MASEFLQLHVRGTGNAPRGILECPGRRLRCTLGRGGVRADKQEGDGATPAGSWPLRRVLYRPDRVPPPETALPVEQLTESDGWCDDPRDAAYNKPVRLPYPASAEEMWRPDRLYDIVVVIGHNDDPAIPGLGSAIFMHLADPDGKATAGCIGLALSDLTDLLRHCGPGTRLIVEP